MELSPEAALSSVLTAKTCSLAVSGSRLRHGGGGGGDGEAGAERVAAKPPPAQLHFLRIYLLIYHTAEWFRILQTSGVSRQKWDDGDECRE
jgi:hypothetical protein